MRVLLVTDVYPPIMGGVERHVRDLALGLAQRGDDVTVATLQHGDAPTLQDDGGVRVYRLPGTIQRLSSLYSDTGRRYAPPLPDPETTAALATVIARERPQVVHAHNWLVHSFLPLKAWSGARLVVSLHEYSLACPKKSLIYFDAPCTGPAPIKCLRCCTDHYGAGKGLATVLGNAVSGIAERALVDIFLPVSRAVASGSGLSRGPLPYEVVPNFIPDEDEPDDGTPLMRPLALPKEFILFVGALGRHKGVDVLLRAYAQLPGAPPLVLMGTPWSDTPRRFPPNVIVLHDVPHHAVMRSWRQALVALAPSAWPEPCPTVVLEAMAAGCPVVASRTGGVPDLVAHEETGILVTPGDSSELRDAIGRLLADAALRDQLGRGGERKVAAFRASAVIPRIRAIYHRLVENGESARLTTRDGLIH